MKSTLRNGIIQLGVDDWKFVIDDNDNLVIQHYNGATWDNIFSFVT